jgi:hypothetical protein
VGNGVIRKGGYGLVFFYSDAYGRPADDIESGVGLV